MLVYTQSKMGIMSFDVLNIDKVDPTLETEDQEYCLVGFNALYDTNGFVLAIYPNKDAGIAALKLIMLDIKNKNPRIIEIK